MPLFSKVFSKDEIRDLAIAVTAVTVIFAYDASNPMNTISYLPLSFAAVVTAFLFHELAHRFVARRLGCVARYKMWVVGLVFGLLLMLVDIKFVAPGAVVIFPYAFGRWGFKAARLSMVEIGLVAFVGPAVNLIFAVLFRLFPGDIFSFLASINAWLAFFNLWPVKPLDGSKIFLWKPWFWLLLFIAAVLLVLPPGIFETLKASMFFG